MHIAEVVGVKNWWFGKKTGDRKDGNKVGEGIEDQESSKKTQYWLVLGLTESIDYHIVEDLGKHQHIGVKDHRLGAFDKEEGHCQQEGTAPVG